MPIKDILYSIEKEITAEFPIINVFVQHIKETEEYFVLIDDKAVFETEQFQKFIFEKRLSLWDLGIINICFAYDDEIIHTESITFSSEHELTAFQIYSTSVNQNLYVDSITGINLVELTPADYSFPQVNMAIDDTTAFLEAA